MVVDFFQGGDGVCFFVFSGAAISPFGLIGGGGELEVFFFQVGDWLGKGEAEAVLGEVHLGEVEGSFSVVGDSLESLGRASPAADGLADVEGFSIR